MTLRVFVTVVSMMFLVGAASKAQCAAALSHQDVLIRESDVIAVVDILDRVIPLISGSVLYNKTEFPTAPILYQSKVIQTLYVEIAAEPFIIKFDGAGDRNLLEKGRYLLFLRSEGHLFTPIETCFKIEDGKVFWFTKPFISGGYGPDMGKVPLDKAIIDVKSLIEKYKKS